MSGQGKGCGQREKTPRGWDDAVPDCSTCGPPWEENRAVLALPSILAFLGCSAAPAGSLRL